MSQLSPYRDKRQNFFREHFTLGLGYADYLAASDEKHAQRWKSFAEQISLSAAQTKVVQSFTRKLYVLMMSGVWCGDCARQGPMLQALVDANPKIELRFLDNKQYPELQDELRINGAEKVPVVVVLSEDFFELARFGDRHLSVYRRKGQTELGAACDPGIITNVVDELQTELGEWVDFFERTHWITRLAPALRRKYND